MAPTPPTPWDDARRLILTPSSNLPMQDTPIERDGRGRPLCQSPFAISDIKPPASTPVCTRGEILCGGVAALRQAPCARSYHFALHTPAERPFHAAEK
jgi:hypothetical protein